MTNIRASIIADSVSESGNRLTTFEISYPRYILAEVNTHRMLSKNSASSRAIPLARMLDNVTANPVIPIEWQDNLPGMQGKAITEYDRIEFLNDLWIKTLKKNVKKVEKFDELGVHKQLPNRILEPWFHTNTVITGTDWENFFRLRNHKDAAPAIQELARRMEDLYLENVPTKLRKHQWHLPYSMAVNPLIWDGKGEVPDALKVSVARCARVSYKTFDGKMSTPEKDIKLFDRLITQKPAHASPTEHQACPVGRVEYAAKSRILNTLTGRDYYVGNLNGWTQFRKLIKEENIEQNKYVGPKQ